MYKYAVKIRKTKLMEVGEHWVILANDHITIKNDKTFKYLGSLLANENYIQGNIK